EDDVDDRRSQEDEQADSGEREDRTDEEDREQRQLEVQRLPSMLAHVRGLVLLDEEEDEWQKPSSQDGPDVGLDRSIAVRWGGLPVAFGSGAEGLRRQQLVVEQSPVGCRTVGAVRERVALRWPIGRLGTV